MAIRGQTRRILGRMRRKKPSIEFVGAATGTISVGMPAHQIGDLIIACVFRDGGTFTVPAGWTQLVTNSQSSYQQTLYYKIATTNAETSGSWTSATDIAVVIYRGVDPVDPFGGSSVNTGASGTLSRVSFTPTVMDGTSWFLVFFACRTTAQSPSYSGNYTERATRENATATSEIWVADTNASMKNPATSVPNAGITTAGATCSVIAAELKAHAA
ncbi:minor tail protein [Rhizobium phage RHEph22]|uniref:Uncharacterized protein n=1 Tax=Rhizobium phage RHEph22 TaxID=2836135 RepID=A0AAE7VMZ7_9CAUD|nr:minor tail protein [Rhizobium phage RHEph22]QXV74713.1 hypothetical protein [Rhizobium phage RHEph22]QXV74808.1 hypothetical protein [Rhizobium phage RHEph24]